MSHPRPPDDDPNIEPDLMQEMIDTDPRRRPALTWELAERQAEEMGDGTTAWYLMTHVQADR